MQHFEFGFDLRNRKSYSILSPSQKNRVIAFLYKNFLFFFELLLMSYGLEIRSMELGICEKEFIVTDNDLTENMIKIKCKKFYRILKVNNSYHGPSGNPDNDLMKIQGIKDKTNQSNESYGLFRNAINDLLRQAKQNYKLASKKKMNSFKLKLNKFYDINTNRFGCYVNVKEKIYFTLKKISEYMVKNGQSIKDNVFNIHLSGDGCTITRTLKNFVNFTFKVLNENDNSTSGLYTLGIFKVNETYENLFESLNQISIELESIKEIIINGIKYTINYTQGGDLKWLNLINGIKASNSSDPCPWCLWHIDKSKIKDKETDEERRQRIREILNEKWSIDGRTFENIVIGKNGFKHLPIFKLASKKSIVDTLHLCLRITDIMFEHILWYLDSIEGKGMNLETRHYLRRLIKFCEQNCNVTNAFYESKTGDVELRSINQTERLKILEGFKQKSIVEVLGLRNNNTLLYHFVLVRFYELYLDAKKDYTNEFFDKENFSKELKKWLESFLTVIDRKNLTPYIHTFVFHVPEFIERYRNINLYNCQALEKLNSNTKNNYFRSTNRRENSLRQLLEKANRLEFKNLQGTVEELYLKIQN